MLESRDQSPVPAHRSEAGPVYDWKWMAKSLVRHWKPLVIVPLLFMFLASAYVLLRPGHYTAAAMLNVTNLRLMSSGQDTFFAESQFDPTFLETQIQIIGSDPISAGVMRKLGLLEGDATQQADALKIFRNPLDVRRVGQSNLVQVVYTATDPNRAAEIANEIANEYLAKLQLDREAAVQTASSWLRDRLRGVGTQAQIVSSATPPVDKSDLRGILIVAAAGVAGFAAGLFLSLVLGFLDRSIKDAAQLEAATGAQTLGLVPEIATPTDEKVPQTKGFTGTSLPSTLSIVKTAPFSPVWQALRRVANTENNALLTQNVVRIAITSPSKDDGKTTMAANLALLAADSGKKVLLVDAEPHNQTLSRLLAPNAKAGLSTMVQEASPDLASRLTKVSASGVDFLPFGSPKNLASAAQSLWSEKMTPVLETMNTYDLVVFDLPSLVSSGELDAAAEYMDGVLLVTQWGKTSSEELGALLTLAPQVHTRLMGTILNKVSLSAVERLFSPEVRIMARQAALSATQAPQGEPSA